MLAFDHGYIMGPTSGLERLDLSIVPLIEYADSLMCTRGALRSVVPPVSNKPICLRYSAGTTVLTELNNECILDIKDAIRLNASALAVMVSIGDTYEGKTIENLVRTADFGYTYGIPTMGVTAVGKLELYALCPPAWAFFMMPRKRSRASLRFRGAYDYLFT